MTFALLAALSLAGCASDEDSTGLGVDATDGVTTTSTRIDSGGSTTTSAVVDRALEGERTSELAAQGLVGAWKADDREAAGDVAQPAAVDAMFRVKFESEAAAPTLQACELNPGFENREVCSFAYPGGSAHFIMSQAGDRWSVERIEYVAE